MGEPQSTRIEPVTLDRADALLSGDARYTERFGQPVADGYLDFPEVLPVLRAGLADGADPDWNSHLIVDVASNTVVGFGGFKGPPDNGEVEIGYSVAPAHRRRGYATATVRLLVAKARAGGATLVVANTLSGPNPSTGVLDGCGFTHTDEFTDPDVGLVWRWELPLG